MTLASVLARGRTAAEALMTDTCTIVEVTGQITDPLTGQIAETTTQRYTGVCRLQRQPAPASGQQTGAGRTDLLSATLQLPITAPDIAVGMLATITASVHDPALVGVRLRVTGPHHKSHATSRRLPVDEVVG